MLLIRSGSGSGRPTAVCTSKHFSFRYLRCFSVTQFPACGLRILCIHFVQIRYADTIFEKRLQLTEAIAAFDHKSNNYMSNANISNITFNVFSCEIPANIGAIVGAIIWFLIFIPFAFLQPRYNVMSRGIKMLWSVGTNIGICWCCQLFCRLEGTGMGAQWETFFRGATPDDTFCLADCVLVMILNGMVFLLLSGYVEAVWPGEYGIPQPWYFFLTVCSSIYFQALKREETWMVYFNMSRIV